MAERDDEREPGAAGDAGGLGAHFRSHARGLSAVAIASVLGVLASFAFQVGSARYLAPADFGLLSAFLVIVSVAAIGSSSLQNIVTVQTAAEFALRDDARPTRRAPWEAIAIGLIGGGAVAAVSPWLADALDTSSAVVIAAGLCVPLSFLFADALGLLQGSGDVSRAVWWSTISLILRVVILLVAVVAAAGIAGVIGSVVLATALAVVGAVWSARHIRRPGSGAFTSTGLTIVLLTVAFAWLTSSDVLFLRAGAEETVAGNYAAVTVLVKAGFLVPSTLSLYLLPRFVRNRDNPALSRVGVLVTLGVSLATSAAMTVFFLLFGTWLIGLLYGPPFQAAASLLVPVSLAYMPWMAAQGMLIKMTSYGSRGGAIALVTAVVAQWIAFALVIPDLMAMLMWLGVIGGAVLAAFLVLDSREARRRAAGRIVT